jgi:putative endopeptidase
VKKVLSVILVFILVLSLGTAVSAAPIDSDPTQFTNAEAAWALYKAADFYNPDVKYKEVLGDYDEDSLLTVANAYIMADRAFGTLPAPAKEWIKNAADEPLFTDVPEAAITAVENLSNARVILDQSGSGLMNPDEILTEAEFTKLVRRIYAVYGENLADDFFYTVNKEYFTGVSERPGYTSFGVVTEANSLANEQLSALLREFAEGEFEQGTRAQKAATFYNAFLRLGDKDVNLKHVKGYFTAIDEAQTVEEIHSVFLQMVDEIGYNGFFTMPVDGNFREDNKNIYVMTLPKLTLDYAEGLYADPESFEITESYIAELLTLIGDSNPEENAAAVAEFEKNVAAAALAPGDALDMEKAYLIYTLSEVQGVIPGWDMSSIMALQGYEPSPEQLVFIPDEGKYKEAAKVFEPENIDLLKTLLKLDVVKSRRRYLGDSFRTAYQNFAANAYGSIPVEKEEYYTLAAIEEMNLLLQSVYVEYYVDPRTKADIEEMSQGMIDTFIKRMDSYEWMDEETREAAKTKLANLKVVACHPDNMHTSWDDIEVTSDDAFEIISDYNKANFMMEDQGYGDDPDIDFIIMNGMKTYEVNAMNLISYNTIYMPAGHLVSPFYDPDASFEANLGGIAVTIGHEITHAFDNSGSQFDEKGIVRNWWTDEDFAAFDIRVNEVINYYDGYEFAAGIDNIAAQTVGENIADIGGVSVALEYLGNTEENPDYDEFFRYYALSWAQITSHQNAAAGASSDVHSGHWVRVNAVLPLFDEFYEVYDIKKGDGMYIAPEDRVFIW